MQPFFSLAQKKAEKKSTQKCWFCWFKSHHHLGLHPQPNSFVNVKVSQQVRFSQLNFLNPVFLCNCATVQPSQTPIGSISLIPGQGLIKVSQGPIDLKQVASELPRKKLHEERRKTNDPLFHISPIGGTENRAALRNKSLQRKYTIRKISFCTKENNDNEWFTSINQRYTHAHRKSTSFVFNIS